MRQVVRVHFHATAKPLVSNRIFDGRPAKREGIGHDLQMETQISFESFRGISKGWNRKSDILILFLIQLMQELLNDYFKKRNCQLAQKQNH